MKITTTIDRRGITEGQKLAVIISDDEHLIACSTGVFGWSGETRHQGGFVTRYHNGEPYQVEKWGKVLWNKFNTRWSEMGYRAAQQAQRAFWEFAFNRHMRLQ